MLSDLVYDVVGRRPLIVPNVHDAVVAIDRRVPEVILLPALMPPADEARLLAQLRMLPPSVCVETLITPVFPQPAEVPEAHGRWDLFKLRPKPKDWTPAVAAFAEQLLVYLERGGRSIALRAAFGERRASTRIADVTSARVALRGLDVDIVDLSLTGAQVLSEDVQVPGTVVPVTIGDDRTALEVECEALIVWGAFEIQPSTQLLHYRAGVAWKGADDQFLRGLCNPQALARLAARDRDAFAARSLLSFSR